MASVTSSAKELSPTGPLPPLLVPPVSVPVPPVPVPYGARADDVFASEYLGYPNGLSFVRGYSFFSYDANECTGMSVGSCPTLNRLQGTRLAMASIELRVPLFGNERYGLVNFPYLPTELALFADGGVAWSDEEAPVLKFSTDSSERTPVFSAGVTSRFNLFNAVILEIFYAHPFQRPEKGSHFGIQLVPGW
jgi:outer membrane protein assembly factor BamA